LGPLDGINVCLLSHVHLIDGFSTVVFMLLLHDRSRVGFPTMCFLSKQDSGKGEVC